MRPKQTTLNYFTSVIQADSDPSKHLHTVSISLQQKHCTALDIKEHFMQEHCFKYLVDPLSMYHTTFVKIQINYATMQLTPYKCKIKQI